MSYETDAADTSSASTDHNHSWLQLCRNKCLIICVKLPKNDLLLALPFSFSGNIFS